MRGFILQPARHRLGERRVPGSAGELRAESRFERRRSAGPSNVAATSALCAFIALRWTNWRLTAKSGASS